jgi:hypothetical protein
MDILLGTALGTMIAFLLAVPAIILDTSRRVKNLPLLIDVYVWRGKKLSDGEIFAVGLLLHLLIGALYGFFYTLFASKGWLFITNSPYTLASMLIFAVASWLVLNIILLPLFGLGFFGSKEGNTVWFETLTTLLLEGAILWIIINYYQPFYFL